MEAGATCGSTQSPSKWHMTCGTERVGTAVMLFLCTPASCWPCLSVSPGRLLTPVFSPSMEAPMRSWKSSSPATSWARSEKFGRVYGGGALGKVAWFAQMLFLRKCVLKVCWTVVKSQATYYRIEFNHAWVLQISQGIKARLCNFWKKNTFFLLQMKS